MRRRSVLCGLAALAVSAFALLLSGCADDVAGVGAPSESSEAAAVVEAVATSRSLLGTESALRSEAPSLVFPEGTTYDQALLELLLIQVAGKQETAATLGPPLAPGIVFAEPAGDRRRPALSLAAPFGYDTATGVSFGIPPFSAPPAGAPVRRSTQGPWLEGSGLAVPLLPGCMISRDPAAPVSRCAPSDQARVDADEQAPVPLP